MLAVSSNGFVVVDAAVERVVKVRLPTGEWQLTTRENDGQSNSRRLYHNDDQGGGGSYYLNGMCRNRLGWTVHCPGTANYWRAHQAPNVDSAYFFAGSPAPAAVHPNRLSRLLGCHGSATLRKATHVAPSHTTSSDWLTWSSYAQHLYDSLEIILRLRLFASSAPQSSCLDLLSFTHRHPRTWPPHISEMCCYRKHQRNRTRTCFSTHCTRPALHMLTQPPFGSGCSHLSYVAYHP